MDNQTHHCRRNNLVFYHIFCSTKCILRLDKQIRRICSLRSQVHQYHRDNLRYHYIAYFREYNVRIHIEIRNLDKCLKCKSSVVLRRRVLKDLLLTAIPFVCGINTIVLSITDRVRIDANTVTTLKLTGSTTIFFVLILRTIHDTITNWSIWNAQSRILTFEFRTVWTMHFCWDIRTDQSCITFAEARVDTRAKVFSFFTLENCSRCSSRRRGGSCLGSGRTTNFVFAISTVIFSITNLAE